MRGREQKLVFKKSIQNLAQYILLFSYEEMVVESVLWKFTQLMVIYFLRCSVCNTCSILLRAREPCGGARPPQPRPGRELGPHWAFPFTAKSLEILLSLHLHSWGRLAKQAPLTVNFLLMAFTIHDQAAQNQLTFPLGLFSSEADAQMECKCWKRSGGQTQWARSFQKHPKPTPSRLHWSPIPPGQTPTPCCWGSEPKAWTWPWKTVSAHRHHQHALKGIRPTQFTSKVCTHHMHPIKRGPEWDSDF